MKGTNHATNHNTHGNNDGNIADGLPSRQTHLHGSKG